MIPLRIKVVNFLSYRDEVELDLRGVHVACLSGDNGHGKTAILDSITWALWGWARGRRYGQGGSSPDELVHQGQSDMEVSLEFSSGDATYRVVRKYSKGIRARNSATILDLQVATGNEFSSLSVGGVLETERRLYELLSMDYETFVNSAFLLQGDADRFTTSQPARRKEILAEILGLSLYERLADKARGSRREQEAILIQTRLREAVLSEEVQTRPLIEISLTDTLSSLEKISTSFSSLTEDLEVSRNRLRKLRESREEIAEIIATSSRNASEISSIESQIDSLNIRINHNKAILEQRQDIENGIAQFATTQEELLSLDQSHSQHVDLSKQILAIESVIAQQRVALETEKSALEYRVTDEINPKLGRMPQIEASLNTIKHELVEGDKEAGGIATSKVHLDQINREFDSLTEENARLLESMQDLRSRLDRQGTDEGICPLCGTALDQDLFNHLRQEMELQGINQRESFRQNQTQLKSLELDRNRAAKQIQTQEDQLAHKKSSLLARQGGLMQELDDCKLSASDLKEFSSRLALLNQKLNSGAFAQTDRANLDTVTDRFNQLDYDPTYHEVTRKRLRELEPYSRLTGELGRAQIDLPDQSTTLEELNSLLEVRKQDERTGAGRLEILTQELGDLPDLEIRETSLAEQHRLLDLERGNLRAEVRLYEFQIQELTKKEADLTTIKLQADSQESELSIYALLEDAFGRGGIQALLIEAAIPSLEVEANAILAKLTDNRMHLVFETQRQNKRGDVTEILEIRISDELGTRSYELFSGGEAFRINFAIRVALSKLLASRSGAPLRALFLDEGFGTQDVDGRNRLTDALSSIQDEFDLILVITHVEQIKEAFPVRIEINKSDSGSSIQTIWAG